VLGLTERRKQKLVETLLAASRALVACMYGGARTVAAAACRT
jgi:hypothetical protein